MWPNLKLLVDLVTFTEKILNGKLHFCTVQVIEQDPIIRAQMTNLCCLLLCNFGNFIVPFLVVSINQQLRRKTSLPCGSECTN